METKVQKEKGLKSPKKNWKKSWRKKKEKSFLRPRCKIAVKKVLNLSGFKPGSLRSKVAHHTPKPWSLVAAIFSPTSVSPDQESRSFFCRDFTFNLTIFTHYYSIAVHLETKVVFMTEYLKLF